MKTAIYVFIGVLSAIVVAYLLSELLAYIRKANRAIKNTKLTPYSDNCRIYRPYSSFNNNSSWTPPWYRNPNEPPWSNYDVHFDKIELKLRNMEDKINLLVDDFEEIMIDKERPSDE